MYPDAQNRDVQEPDVVEVVHQLGGIASTRDLVPLFDRREVDAAVASRELRRVGRGRFAIGGIEESLVAARRSRG